MRTYSEETAREIDNAVRGLVSGAFARARSILQANHTLLEESAKRLLQQETLDEEQLKELAARVRLAPAA